MSRKRDLGFRIQFKQVSREDAILEVWTRVKDVSSRLDTDLLCSAEMVTNSGIHVKLAQASQLLHEAMNELILKPTLTKSA